MGKQHELTLRGKARSGAVRGQREKGPLPNAENLL